MRKHNAFSGVGGGLRRGVYINKEQRLMTFVELAHMLDATQLCLEGICLVVFVQSERAAELA